MRALLWLLLPSLANAQPLPNLRLPALNEYLESRLPSMANPSIFAVEKDTRGCPSPFCGGYFLTSPDGGMLNCPDGTRIPRGCYVAGLNMEDWNPVSSYERAHVWKTLEGGGSDLFNRSDQQVVLVMGKFLTGIYEGYANMADFAVTAVWTTVAPQCQCRDNEVCIDDPRDDCTGCDCPSVCASKEPQWCGGDSEIRCVKGFTCKTWRGNYCDPKWDCIGQCQADDDCDDDCGASVGSPCGNGVDCRAGLWCVDPLDDDCNGSCGDADCPGICIVPPY